MQDQWNKADSIFDRIKKNLEKPHKGKILAIEPESEDYYIAETELAAYKEGQKKHPGKKFYYKRIGASHTHFVGCR